MDSARRSLPLRYEAPKTLRLKTRRRRERILMFCICILGAVGLVSGLGAASHLEKFAIKDISVTGVQKLSSEALTAVAGATLKDEGFKLFSRKNMFLYPRFAIEDTLAANFPRIKNVSVARQSLLAQAITVTVEERTPFATWCSKDAICFLMDENGFIFEEAGEVPLSSYIFRGGLLPHADILGQTFLRGRIQEIVQFLHDLEKAGFKASGITVDSEKDFTVVLENGPMLLASFQIMPSDIIHNLQTALEADGLRKKLEKLQYIDLRFGNRVYYK